MHLDATMKGRGRMDMREICVYHVRDDKIVQEQFFYDVH
jgi:ketosteroid isomerase-like protein